MPFRYGAWWVLGLVGLTVWAFWPGYFSVLTETPWEFHFHGVTATGWMLLLALQSWSIQAGRRALHRAAGIGSLIFFPIFLAGSVAVVISMARGSEANPFYIMYGPRLGSMDILAPFVLAWLFYQGLSQRRSVQLHARYLMATVLLLLMPILGRLADEVVPALAIEGPQDFYLFAWSSRLSSVIALAVTAALYAGAPRHGRPFLAAGAVILVQTILFDTLGATPWWRASYIALGQAPMLPVLAATAIAGAAVSWFGWTAARPVRRAAAT